MNFQKDPRREQTSESESPNPRITLCIQKLEQRPVDGDKEAVSSIM
jgi:hypothetical protein